MKLSQYIIPLPWKDDTHTMYSIFTSDQHYSLKLFTKQKWFWYLCQNLGLLARLIMTISNSFSMRGQPHMCGLFIQDEHQVFNMFYLMIHEPEAIWVFIPKCRLSISVEHVYVYLQLFYYDRTTIDMYL